MKENYNYNFTTTTLSSDSESEPCGKIERDLVSEKATHSKEVRERRKTWFTCRHGNAALPLTCYSIGSARPSVLSQPPQEYEHESRRSIALKIYHAAVFWGRLFPFPPTSVEKGRQVRTEPGIALSLSTALHLFPLLPPLTGFRMMKINLIAPKFKGGSDGMLQSDRPDYFLGPSTLVKPLQCDIERWQRWDTKLSKLGPQSSEIFLLEPIVYFPDPYSWGDPFQWEIAKFLRTYLF